MAARKPNDDHDLLVRIDEKLVTLKEDFVNYRRDSQAALSLKADQTEVVRLEGELKAHNERLGRTESFMYRAVGIVGFIEVIAACAVAIHYWLK